MHKDGVVGDGQVGAGRALVADVEQQARRRGLAAVLALEAAERRGLLVDRALELLRAHAAVRQRARDHLHQVVELDEDEAALAARQRADRLDELAQLRAELRARGRRLAAAGLARARRRGRGACVPRGRVVAEARARDDGRGPHGRLAALDGALLCEGARAGAAVAVGGACQLRGKRPPNARAPLCKAASLRAASLAPSCAPRAEATRERSAPAGWRGAA